MKVGGSHAGVEIMLLTILSGARFVEVPVNYLPRVGVSSVTGNPVKAVGGRTADDRAWCCACGARLPRRSERPPAFVCVASRGGRTRPVSNSHFDEIAGVYDESLPAHVVEHYLRKRTAFVVAHSAPRGRALDVGCGTGALAERLAGAGYEVIGIDPSEGMLEVLRRRGPTSQAFHASGTELPFERRQLRPRLTRRGDAPHRRSAGRSGRRSPRWCGSSRPGGRVLIWDHNPRNPYWGRLMARVPQDTGEERLIGEQEIVGGLRCGRCADRRSHPSSASCPTSRRRGAMRAAAGSSAAFERTPYVHGSRRTTWSSRSSRRALSASRGASSATISPSRSR